MLLFLYLPLTEHLACDHDRRGARVFFFPAKAEIGYRGVDRGGEVLMAGSAGPLNRLQVRTKEAGKVSGQVVVVAVTLVSRSRVGKAA